MPTMAMLQPGVSLRDAVLLSDIQDTGSSIVTARPLGSAFSDETKLLVRVVGPIGSTRHSGGDNLWMTDEHS